MSTAFLIPWGGDDPYRLTALHHVLGHLVCVDETWLQILAVDDRTPFSRSRALNNGFKLLPDDCDVIVLNDADSLVPEENIREAVRLARAEPGLVFAFTKYVRLKEDRTIDVRFEYAGSQGVVAIRRSCFIEAGGLDPRFEAWGYEDLAFGLVCESLWPMRRVEGNLYHVYHPPRDTNPLELEQIQANLRLYERYAAAAADKRKLAAIRAEAAVFPFTLDTGRQLRTGNAA